MNRFLVATAAILPVALVLTPQLRGQNVPNATGDSVAATPPEESPAVPVRRQSWVLPEGSLVLNLPSDQTLPKGMLQFLVTHRFRAPVRGSDAHSWYSLDSGADFGVGFAYSPLEHVEASLYRSGIQDDYEIAAKFSERPGGPESAIGLALRVGADDRRDPMIVDANGSLLPDARARTSFFAQGVVTLHLALDRIEVSAVPTYSSRTTAQRRAFNVPVHAAVALSRSWNLQAEYQPPRRGVGGSIATWAAGLEKVLYRHRFEIVVSNTTVTTIDQRLSGDFAVAQIRQQRSFDNGFRNNDWHIGFNLVRQFKP
ncbi:MAG: DUF5777 family beta-barrel protein [Thermoanaerobaculia bacterium]